MSEAERVEMRVIGSGAAPRRQAQTDRRLLPEREKRDLEHKSYPIWFTTLLLLCASRRTPAGSHSFSRHSDFLWGTKAVGFSVKTNGTECLLREGMTGVPENHHWPSAIAPPGSKVEVQMLIPPEFFDQIARSPETARERQRRPDENRHNAYSQTVGSAVNKAYIAAKNPWLQSQFHIPFGLGDQPFVVGRRPVAGEEQPPYQPDLKLDDTVPFRLSRNHFIIEKREGYYHVRDLYSTLGTIVNGEPIGDYLRAEDAVLGAGDNEVIAGGLGSPFVFLVSVGWRDPR